MDERRLQVKQEHKGEVVKEIVKQQANLRSMPLGEEILKYAVDIMGGPQAVATELVALFNEANSPTVRKDILKMIVMGSIQAEKGKPKTDLGTMSSEDLNEAIETKIVELAEKVRKRTTKPAITVSPSASKDGQKADTTDYPGF